VAKDIFIFEVSEKSFGQSVILNSHKIPVLVEFMGVWSEPCVLQADIFSSLAKEFAEQFIFAKVDIDEQAALKQQYNIEHVPTILVFKDGEAVHREVGQLQENEARSLLKDFGVYRQSDALREQARELHLAGDTGGAILQLTEAIKQDPGNTRIAMDMVQIFIDMGELEQARSLYAKLPEKDRHTDMGKMLTGQLTFLDLASKTDGIQVLTQRIATRPDDYDAHFDLGICYVASHEYQQAMDQLLYILQQQPDYKQGAAREMIITIINTIAPVNNELAQEFRRTLANTLGH